MVMQYRPWGYFKTLAIGHNYKVKELTVFPGEAISFQIHEHRDELWHFVGGEGVMDLGDLRFPVRYGQVQPIGKGVLHSIECTGGEDLVIIEVQTGSYLEEDDIVRLRDKYGRA